MTAYRPARTISGPAHARPFRIAASVVTLALVIYALSVAARFPLANFSAGTLWLLGGMSLLLVASYWFFLNSTVTIDEHGIRQTWIIDKKVQWHDIRSARLLGIPWLRHVFPPRLMVRTGSHFFVTFNGGSPELLHEYARIALAFQSR